MSDCGTSRRSCTSLPLVVIFRLLMALCANFPFSPASEMRPGARGVTARGHRRRLADGQGVLVEHAERKLAHVRLQQAENFYAVVDGDYVESLPAVGLLDELAARRRARVCYERVGAERAARD